jgi:hypothetical protein
MYDNKEPEKEYPILNRQANRWWRSLSDEARISICRDYINAISDKALTEHGRYVPCAECGSSVHSMLAVKEGKELFCSKKCSAESQRSRKKSKDVNL